MTMIQATLVCLLGGSAYAIVDGPTTPSSAQSERFAPTLSPQPEQQSALILIGSATYAVESEVDVGKGVFGFTQDRNGKIIDVFGPGKGKKETLPLYEVALYVDGDAARSALRSFHGKTLAKLLGKEKFHEAVRRGPFAKAVVISFEPAASFDDVKEDFAARLAETKAARQDVVAFLGCLQKDVPGETVTVSFPDMKTTRVLVAGQLCREILGEPLVGALLGLWIGRERISAEPDGLLASVEPLLQSAQKR